MNVTQPPFACSHTPEFPELLTQLGCSLLVSTYQAGKVIVLSPNGDKLVQLPRTFDTPMGMALHGSRLAVAARSEIVFLANEPRLAAGYPKKSNHYDSLFVPRSAHFCGALNVHDMAFGKNGLVGVNTLFSCLFRLDPSYNFVPLWKPPFISALAPEDRCHLNGMAMVDGLPRFVTALGQTDQPHGWRPDKLKGGVLMDVASGEILLHGLPMPHSPRLINGELYLLLSASGELVKVDLSRGTYSVVTRISGFLRGMAQHGDYLFIGSSHLRKTHTFGDLALAREGATVCGITAVHLPSGAIVGQLRYLNTCEEIYDVLVLPGLLRPGILGTSDPVFRRALSTPDATYWGEEKELTPGANPVVRPELKESSES
jgi:uncharacterized protein (TIGR03032 family)